MAFSEDIRNFTYRRRNLLYLMQRYLYDNGYYDAADSLKREARIGEEYELCDNVDLDAMYLEYANYYNLKFGKYPKILKKAKPVVKIEVAKAATNASSRTKITTQTAAATVGTATVTAGAIGVPTAEANKLKPHKSVATGECYGAAPLFTVKKLQTEQSCSGGGSKPCALPEIEHGQATLADDALFSSVDWQQLAEIVKTTIMREPLKLAWSDICGNRQAIELLKEAVLTPIQYPKLFAQGLKPWRSLLLHGPPGSGKTLLAKTLYAEAQAAHSVTCFNITSSIVVSKWRGESEKLLRVLFHMAEKLAPSIIFIDEIEGLASKRDRATDHESSKRFKNELLQLLDGMEHQLHGVFILASTNLPWELDEAFLRRFEKKLLVELPNAAERARLIGKLLAASGISLPVQQIATLVKLSDHFTGDEIRLACKEIAMQHVRDVLSSHHGKAIAAAGDAGRTLSMYECAFEQIKPLSVKLLGRHQQWQLEHGS